MATLVEVIVVALIAFAIWRLCRPQPAFVVRVENGAPRATKGTVTRAFLEEVRSICEAFEIRSGRVRGVVRDGRIRLEFSSAFPPPSQQRLRNWWAMEGW